MLLNSVNSLQSKLNRMEAHFNAELDRLNRKLGDQQQQQKAAAAADCIMIVFVFLDSASITSAF